MNNWVLCSLSYPLLRGKSRIWGTLAAKKQLSCHNTIEDRDVFRHLREDIQTILLKDPAARSLAEVLTYAGFWALFHHRIAHRFYRRGWFFPARVVSQWSRFLTNIEIHPGATIGRRFFMDHGAGIVIGETAIVADDVFDVSSGDARRDFAGKNQAASHRRQQCPARHGSQSAGQHHRRATVRASARTPLSPMTCRPIPALSAFLDGYLFRTALHISQRTTAQVMDQALGNADPMGEIIRRSLREIEALKCRLEAVEEEQHPTASCGP